MSWSWWQLLGKDGTDGSGSPHGDDRGQQRSRGIAGDGQSQGQRCAAGGASAAMARDGLWEEQALAVGEG